MLQLLKYTKRLAKQQKTRKTVSEAGDGGKGIKPIRNKQMKTGKEEQSHLSFWLGVFKLKHPHLGH